MRNAVLSLIFAAFFAQFLNGCASAPPRFNAQNYPKCAVSNASLEYASGRELPKLSKIAEPKPYTVEEVFDAAADSPKRKLSRAAGVEYGAVISYPSAEGWLKNKSFMKDDALALLWHSWNEERATAKKIVGTIMLLQNFDGGFGAVFSVSDGFYNSAYVDNEAVAWTGYALAYYAKKFQDDKALEAAIKAAAYLRSQTEKNEKSANFGLVKGGKGKWSDGFKTFDNSYDDDFSSSEKQFAASMLYSLLHSDDAGGFGETIFSSLFIQPEGRFALGASAFRRNNFRSLAASGAIGALWLFETGKRNEAQQSAAYFSKEFAASAGGVKGYKPYLDSIAAEYTPEWDDLITLEGSLAAGLALLRLGDAESAKDALKTALSLSCMTGGGVPSANKDMKGFYAQTSAGASLWTLFLERELTSGRKSPLFHLEEK